MKMEEFDKLDKMCTAIYYTIEELCNGERITMIGDEFTMKDYEDCVAILVKERMRKARTNKRTADYIAKKRETNPNYAR